mmetsp:Transcript_81378/g.143637  ORF Transcript_81378/g.143637 Transcript_81378/m.143637 type:complete len:552 (-) Transcript_81378:84-1739(-)
MAPYGLEEDLDSMLPLISELRGVEKLQVDLAALHEVRTFLRQHEAESSNTATHIVLENYPDWWVQGRRAPAGLDVQGQENLEELQRHAGFLYSLGIPLTLAERRTPSFRFFLDIEAWGSREVAPPSELIGPDTALARCIGSFVGEVFPSHGGFLDAAIYNASGLSQTKGVRKASLRLVWPGVFVSADRVMRVRDLLVSRLMSASAEGGELAELEGRLKQANSSNAWHAIVGDAAYGSRASVRMPLSDKVAPLPLRGPEKRPFLPVGVLRFSYGAEGKVSLEWLCQEADLEPAEWMKIGCLRQEGEVELTEWNVPSVSGNQNVPPTAGRGRVKVRTSAGSDGPGAGGGLRLRNSKTQAQPERAGLLTTVERSFTLTPEELSGKIEQQMGKASVEPDGALVWKQPSSEARIIMYKEDQSIKVVGRPNQVRSLVLIIAPYTEAPKGIGFNSGEARRAPSEAFAPPVSPNKGSEPVVTAKNADEKIQEKGEEGRLHVAALNFEPQGQGELGLSSGDLVRVTMDPEAGTCQDRWVFGRIEASGQCGWFPLSHVVPS